MTNGKQRARIGRWSLVIGHLLAAVVALAGCASAPVYPDPTPGYGQILVELKGVPREGVKGPVRETIRDEYSSHSESVEKGKAFERVKYDELEDVLTLLTRVDGKQIYALPPSFDDSANRGDLELSKDGFLHHGKPCRQIGRGLLPRWFTFGNSLDVPAEFFLENEKGEITSIPVASRNFERRILAEGVYSVTCDQFDHVTCRIVVTQIGAVSGYQGGGSDLDYLAFGYHVNGFFDGLEPGEYNVVVYAPRLPEVRKQVVVEPGKRTTITAELTVNHLPKAR